MEDSISRAGWGLFVWWHSFDTFINSTCTGRLTLLLYLTQLICISRLFPTSQFPVLPPIQFTPPIPPIPDLTNLHNYACLFNPGFELGGDGIVVDLEGAGDPLHEFANSVSSWLQPFSNRGNLVSLACLTKDCRFLMALP